MKKLFCLLACLLFLTGCSNSQPTTPDTTIDTGTTIEEVATLTDSSDMGTNTDVLSTESDAESSFNTEKLTELGYKLEEITVIVDGLQGEYHFIYISDIHIVVESDEVLPEEMETVRGRIDIYRQPSGLTAVESWEQVSSILDECGADAILMGGDMIDFASSANINAFLDGYNNIETPIVYVGADHDFRPWWCEGVENETISKLYEPINGRQELFLMEFDELCIVGINNNTSQVSATVVEQMEEIIQIGKPIILLQHVPLQSMVDTTLAEQSKEVWQDRALIWGEDCYYVPDENTAKLLDLIYAENSLVEEVVCGHLHFSWDGYLTDTVHQHVFDDGAAGMIGVITVKGK